MPITFEIKKNNIMRQQTSETKKEYLVAQKFLKYKKTVPLRFKTFDEEKLSLCIKKNIPTCRCA